LFGSKGSGFLWFRHFELKNVKPIARQAVATYNRLFSLQAWKILPILENIIVLVA
jgi:hypothetical protein